MFDEIFEFIVKIIDLIYPVIVTVILLIKTGSANKTIKEVQQLMNYDTIDSKKKKAYSQSFTQFSPAYALNAETNELERLPVDKDDQAEIESHSVPVVNEILDKYLHQGVVEQDDVADYISTKSDLNDLANFYAQIEDYRDKLNLSADLSPEQVLAEIKSYGKHLDDVLKAQTEQLKNKTKGGSANGSVAPETSNETL